MNKHFKGNKQVFNESQFEAKRDIHIGDNINNISTEKPVFSEVNLEAYEEPDYVSPYFSDTLAGIIAEETNENFVVITGFFGFDKASFTKHIGLKILEKLEDRGKKSKVQECFLTSDYYGIATSIKESKEDSIYILNNILPKDINHNLEAIKKEATKQTYNKFILISTDLPFSAWTSTDDSYWYEVKADGLYHKGKRLVEHIYSKPKLVSYLLRTSIKRGLGAYRIQLKEIIEKVIYKDITTPEQIDIFLDLFSKKPTTDEKTINNLIAKTKKKDALISQWFDTLEKEQQLIVLGMTIFQGTYEDQFFAVLDRVMQDVWRPYNQSLTALDYTNLDNLLHFFYFTNDQNSLLESKFPNQRFQIFQILWNSYRRRILAILPKLVELVIESIDKPQSNWSLYGTKEKRQKLRLVIADVLSDIGRLSPKAVEQTLLTLAAHDDIGVQVVAAKALAGWRVPYDLKKGEDYQGEKILFALLNRWNDDSHLWYLVSIIRKIFDDKINTSGGNHGSATYTRSTIVLTLGYASAYDDPNHLSSELLKLLKKLVKDRNQLVINGLKRTLHLLVRSHPKQLGSQLFDTGGEINPIFNETMPCEHYIESIAYGLRDAQKDYPEVIEPILASWYKFCNNTRPKESDPTQFTYREKVLCVFVLTLGVLDYEEAKIYTLDKVMDILILLRKVEVSNQVKSVLLNVILHLNEHHNEKIKAFKVNAIPKMEEEERERVVSNFSKKYLKQRKELNGGDYSISIGNVRIDSWVEQAERPPTKIEELIADWLDSKIESIRNIALRSIMEFAKIEAEEKRGVEAFLEKEQHENLIIKKANFKSDKIRTGILDKIMIWDEYRRVLSTLVENDEEMGDEEIKALEIKLKLLGRSKDANIVEGNLFTKMRRMMNSKK